ncbi:MAG: PSD1 domain-containing protein [Planctomycetaceae bacterium]|nr:PSD1 domain-containing protein [Planctomycetaceae bacterium]
MPRTALSLAPLILLAATLPVWSADAPPAADEPLTFERHIRPIFRSHCFDCHGAGEELKGNLDLRLVRLMVKGGDSGAALVAGDAAKSHLLDRIRSGEMPPGNVKVSPAELALLEKWIKSGAKTARPEPESLDKGVAITPEDREFWAFVPVRRPDVPVFAPESRVRTPVDAFLLKAMHDKGLAFSPDADRATLVRRAYFDLIGLPPTPAQIEAFVKDDAPQAWERLIDTLLASPQYGERWGRHWLDVAGYADSEGATADDRVRGYAWKYRDYVIRSFNADKPFNQFLIEQLAGDELITPPFNNLNADQIEKLVATGFLRMAIDGSASVDNDEVRNQTIADTIKIVSTSLLGLSVGCAQCHDHRYDPIPHTDYYRMRAIFEPALNWKTWQNPVARHVSLYTDADRAKAAEVEAQVSVIAKERAEKEAKYMAEALEMELMKHPEAMREPLKTAYQTPAGKRTPEQQKLLKDNPSVNISPGVLYQYNQKAADDLKTYDAKIGEVRKQKPVEDFVRALWETPGNIAPTFLFHRGDYRQPKQQVNPGDLTILGPAGAPPELPSKDPNVPTSGRRLNYAKWLTSGQHPLLARVLVNRVWLHHFGRGLVSTPSDFGRLGERPTHPELLDWLASEFQGAPGNSTTLQPWSLKSLHRLLLTSTAYRQSSARTAQGDMADADNRYYSRMSVRRLDAEVLRDAVLAVNGTLDLTPFGAPVDVMADDAGQITVPEAFRRRSVYVQVRRSQPVALLTAFDAPVIEVNCERRPSSTVATQALMLMNSDFMIKESKRFAERVRADAPALSPGDVPSVELPPRPPVYWEYGYAGFDEASKRVINFTKLPYWTGSAWQGGPTLPDPVTGWATLNAGGGHPGDDQHAVSRRWTSPAAGFITFTGKLQHPSENGTGVRGRVVSSRSGLAAEWTVKKGEASTDVPRIDVQPGDTIDILCDRNGTEESDSFAWVGKLTLKDPTGKDISAWDTNVPFHGPAPKPLSDQAAQAWRLAFGREPTRDELERSLKFLGMQLKTLAATGQSPDRELQAMTDFCQALLGANGFLYVD